MSNRPHHRPHRSDDGFAIPVEIGHGHWGADKLQPPSAYVAITFINRSSRFFDVLIPADQIRDFVERLTEQVEAAEQCPDFLKAIDDG